MAKGTVSGVCGSTSQFDALEAEHRLNTTWLEGLPVSHTPQIPTFIVQGVSRRVDWGWACFCDRRHEQWADTTWDLPRTRNREKGFPTLGINFSISE